MAGGLGVTGRKKNPPPPPSPPRRYKFRAYLPGFFLYTKGKHLFKDIVLKVTSSFSLLQMMGYLIFFVSLSLKVTFPRDAPSICYFCDPSP